MEPTQPAEPRPTAYFDYRKYLADYFAFRKRQDPAYSHRKFLRNAQIGGSAYLVRVLKASRKLNRKYVPRFVAALGLSAREKTYFECLVEFGNEKRTEEKHNFLKMLLQLRAQTPELALRDKRLLFFRRWYYPVVRELIALLDFRGDFALLARSVIPRLTPIQAENAVKFLLKHGFVRIDEAGRYLQTEPFITSGDQPNSVVLDQYHRANLSLNLNALDLVPPDLRSASSLSLTLSEATFERVRRDIAGFRAHLLALAEQEENPERVFHIGFIALARSRKRKGNASGHP